MTSGLFSGAKHAQLYSKFRPSPPQSCTDYIISYLKKKVNPPFGKAVDIGCGSGQSTEVLSPYFKSVLGLDASEAQIKNAQEFHSSGNIKYKQSFCEKLPVESSSVQLVTFCQSVHWFNTDEIFAEVQRILVPNGVVSIYGYWIPLPKINNAYKNNKIRELIVEDLYQEKLGSYWNKERYLVDDHYKSINLPFKDCHRMNFVKHTESTLANYMGYLSSWSAYQKLLNEDCRKSKQFLLEVQNRMITILEEDKAPEDIPIELLSDFFMVIGHK